MNEGKFSPSRRVLIVGGIAALGAAASCRPILPTGKESGASAVAASRVGTIRTGNSLASLAPDTKVEEAALQQARLMAASGRMAHTAISGHDFATRMKKNGIPAPAAENLAQGQMDFDRLLAMWMDSEGHRRNILDPRFARFGLAYAEANEGGRYWAMVLCA
jgi:uncharacterized protein YkwD